MTMDPTHGDIRLVSWDVDGTLYSFTRILRAIAKYRRSTFKDQGWMETGRKLVRMWKFQRTVEHQRRDSDCRVIGSDLERFSETRLQVREVLCRMLGEIRPQSGALDLLGRFARSGIPQVAWSDFNCRYKLDALGIACYFDGTYVSEDIGFWKPSPITLQKIQRDFGIHPENHLHIGDRWDTDGEACLRNGCRFMPIDRLPRFWRTFNSLCKVGSRMPSSSASPLGIRHAAVADDGIVNSWE